MIIYFYTLLAGLIQGITEFLPVSSSGHLVIFHDFLGFEFPDEVAFDVVLHLGTLAALVTFFYYDIVRYLRSFFTSLLHGAVQSTDERVAWYLFWGTFPAAIVGLFFEDAIEFYFRNPVVVAFMLVAVGVALWLADRWSRKDKRIEDLNFIGAMLIGFLQVLALIPGTSRSGITIIAGLSRNLNRYDAARYSFLLSIPVIAGAGLKKTYDLFTTASLSSDEMILLGLGFASAAITGYLAIKYFLKYLQRHSLLPFVVYRFFLAAIIILLLMVNG